MNETLLNWSEDFLERAVTVCDPRADSCLVWLVDFECKIATTGTPDTYSKQEWETFDKPSAEKFLEFWELQKPQSEKTKTSQEYVAMPAEYQRQQLHEQARQKIASEQLASLIVTPQDIWDGNTLFGDSKTAKEAVRLAVKLADLLLLELAEISNK